MSFKVRVHFWGIPGIFFCRLLQQKEAIDPINCHCKVQKLGVTRALSAPFSHGNHVIPLKRVNTSLQNFFSQRVHRESLPPLKITATNNFLGSSSQRTMRGDGRHLTTSDTDSVVTAPRKPHSKHRNSGAKGRQPDTRIECRVSAPNRWMGG